MIEQDQYEAAYKAGLRRHDGEIGMTEVRKLLAGTGMRKASASILAGNVSYMLRGEVYKRAQSIPATDDFLTWILRDRGDAMLRNAIRSVRAHIEYYQEGHEGVRVGLWEILAKHEALFNHNSESAIRLEYDASESRGYIDILPLELFAEEITRKAIIHTVRHHRSGKDYEAKCDITVSGQEAELDYLPYDAFNTKNEMLLGVARLQFEDTDRTAILSVEWKPKHAETFKNCPFKIPTFIVPPALPYMSPSKAAEKSAKMMRDRPGQAAFRRNLKAVYNNCCCISGCSVPQVLEGAHIDPYLAAASDNVQNGLLLRSDLHTLFDCHLISIHPDTHVIHVAPGTQAATGYAGFHGSKINLPLEITHQPDTEALERHWSRFQQKPIQP